MFHVIQIIILSALNKVKIIKQKSSLTISRNFNNILPSKFKKKIIYDKYIKLIYSGTLS